MKKDLKLFCFGFGQVAKYFVKNILKKKYNIKLNVTNTSKTESKKIDNFNYKSYYFNNDNYDKDLLTHLNTSDEVLISIPPKNNKDIVIKEFGETLKKRNFNWITYLSATSIYGDKKGEWVDENTIPTPTSERGIARLAAENSWLKYFQEYNLPVQIFRLSGIYSNEKNIIKRLQAKDSQIVDKRNHFFSRIHVEDIAEILTISLKKFKPGQVFNISDDYPSSNEELARYAAQLINIKAPKKIKPSEIKNIMLKNFYNDSKKVSNNKMKSFFSYNLKFPTFKEGLNAIKNNIS